MHRIFERLRPFIRWVVTHFLVVLLVALGLSVGGVLLATRLSIDTDLANLIPPEYPSVQALEKLRDEVGAESELALAIESPSFESNVAFAEVLIPAALELTGNQYDEPYFRSVDYRKDVEFLENNALYFGTPAELDMLQDYLDAKIEEAALDANPFFFDLDDEDDDSAAHTDSLGDELQAIYRDIVSTEYPISDDSTTLVLRFYPSGSESNIQFIENAYADLEALAESLNPASYHPELKITTAGRLLRRLIEVNTIREDVLKSFGSGVLAVLLMVVLYFFYKSYRAQVAKGFDARVFWRLLPRIPVLAFVIGIPLLMSISWTFGVAYLTYGKLNLMTTTLGLVLFGLGIDYGIHFFARYTEERAKGSSVIEASEKTFSSTGQAIAVGALTTSVALFVLVVADFRGFSQFGFIAGTGILFALGAMLIVLPALIAFFERTGLLKLTAENPIERVVEEKRRFPASRPILIGSALAVIAAIIMLPRVQFEYRMGTLEPTYEEYNMRRDIIRRVYNDRRRRNPAYIVLDDPDEVSAVTDALNRIVESDTLTPTIERFESLQDRFPLTREAQENRILRLEDIREQLADPFIDADTTEDMARLKRAASTREPIAFEDIPEFLRKQFTSKSGDLGNFVIIYPSVGLSDGRQSIAFSEDVGSIVTESGATYHAGSSSLIAADMLKLMKREAPWMVLATLVIVFVLMYLNFGSFRWMILATLPLIVGVLWMILLQEIFDLRLNFYNLIVLPAVLGIGNDAGVHLVHRYREEGEGSILRNLRTTGEHVTMGSLTTMMGFAGLLLSFHPGLNSIGQLAIVGIGSTLAAALFFLPAMIQWLEDRAMRGKAKEVSSGE